MYGKKAYQAYKKGAQYGKFGDNVSQGGKVVKGVDGLIHIEGGIESDIMKAHGSEGEYILAQKQGYQSLDEVPVNEKTGYREYFIHKWIQGTSTYGALDAFMGGYLPGGTEPMHESGQSWVEGFDEYIGDPLQQTLGIGEYSEEAKMQKSLEESMGISFDALRTGSDKMLGEEGWIQKQLDEQLQQFGYQKEGLTQQAGGVRTKMGDAYAGGKSASAKTGLVTGAGDVTNLKKLETAGKGQMAMLGTQRESIWGKELKQMLMNINLQVTQLLQCRI